MQNASRPRREHLHMESLSYLPSWPLLQRTRTRLNALFRDGRTTKWLYLHKSRVPCSLLPNAFPPGSARLFYRSVGGFVLRMTLRIKGNYFSHKGNSCDSLDIQAPLYTVRIEHTLNRLSFSWVNLNSTKLFLYPHT